MIVGRIVVVCNVLLEGGKKSQFQRHFLHSQLVALQVERDGLIHSSNGLAHVRRRFFFSLAASCILDSP